MEEMIYTPNVIDGVPTDYYEDLEERQKSPEESLEHTLLCDAFDVSKEFFAALHEPLILAAITNYFLHVKIERMGYTHHTSEEHAIYIFNVLCGAPLRFEIVTYLGRDKMLYFFGTEYPSLGIPLSIISSSAEIVGRVLRMCSRAQLNVGGSTTYAADAGSGGKHGAAFAHIAADRRSNCVTYSGYKFDATFDAMFPRVPIIAHYVLSFLSHARSVDRENNHHERIALNRSRSASPAPFYSSSSSPSPPPRPSSATPPPPNSMYSNACSILRSALRTSLQMATTPSVPRRSMKVKVGSEHNGQVRVIEEAPADTEELRRLAIIRNECATLVTQLNECRDGELHQFYSESLMAANRGIEKLVHFSF